MKLLQLLFLTLMIVGCANKNTDPQTASTSSEVSKNESLANTENTSDSVAIASLNFDELQQQYFQKKTDTVYIINFWATWCKPCVKELPAFEKIASEYKDEKVKLLLVSLDFPEKKETQVIPFVKKHNIKAEVVLLADDDANSWIPKVSPVWSGAIPATIIYKNENRKFYEQSFTFEELKTELTTFL